MVSAQTCAAFTISHRKDLQEAVPLRRSLGHLKSLRTCMAAAAVRVKASALMQTDCCYTKPGLEGIPTLGQLHSCCCDSLCLQPSSLCL